MKIGSWLNRFWYLITYRFKKPKIRVYQALLSGNGSFIDIRYWISRPDKINPKSMVYLIDQNTGTRLYLMQFIKFGTIRTKHNKYKTTGMLLFRNQFETVKKGFKVTLILDDLKAENIEVM